MPLTNDRQLTVEKSENYFISESAPKRIHDMNEKIKLILAVRDPSERAISDYVQRFELDKYLHPIRFPIEQHFITPIQVINFKKSNIQNILKNKFIFEHKP
jgi:Sulfotransferase domain